MSALLIAPLSIWFVVKLLTALATADRIAAQQWLKDPFAALALALLMAAMFVHSKLGLQVIIEDYVHCEGPKIALLILTKALHLLLAAASLMAIARIHFFGM